MKIKFTKTDEDPFDYSNFLTKKDEILESSKTLAVELHIHSQVSLSFSHVFLATKTSSLR